jgi:hypothetical protein
VPKKEGREPRAAGRHNVAAMLWVSGESLTGKVNGAKMVGSGAECQRCSVVDVFDALKRAPSSDGTVASDEMRQAKNLPKTRLATIQCEAELVDSGPDVDGVLVSGWWMVVDGMICG